MGAIISVCSVLYHSLAQGSGAYTTDTGSHQPAGCTDHASGFAETAATHNIAEAAFVIHSIYDIHEWQIYAYHTSIRKQRRVKNSVCEQ